jgi:hypothetical protein
MMHKDMNAEKASIGSFPSLVLDCYRTLQMQYLQSYLTSIKASDCSQFPSSLNSLPSPLSYVGSKFCINQYLIFLLCVLIHVAELSISYNYTSVHIDFIVNPNSQFNLHIKVNIHNSKSQKKETAVVYSNWKLNIKTLVTQSKPTK